MTGIIENISKLIVQTGKRLSPRVIRRGGAIIREIELHQWMRERGYLLRNSVQRREQLFELVAEEIGEKPVLYLEFGVAQGDCMRLWSKLLRNQNSVLHGFDSFEGLPEKWDYNRPKGMFSTSGRTPSIDDPRIRFFKGLFDQTLGTYRPPTLHPVVINMDADLYSSTAFVLKQISNLIVPGTYLYFDEFSSLGHEELAFRQFVDGTDKHFILRGGTRELIHVLFQCVE